MPGTLQDLAGRFRRFAVQQARPSSPLYSHLALGIAGDPSLLRLAGQATSRPATNLLFAAVHNLLLAGASHSLRSFYPNLTAEPGRAEDAWPHFQDFCCTYEAKICEILTTRRTQTNEVRRCSWLALGLAAEHRTGRPAFARL